MTIHCHDNFEAAGCAIERLKSLGVSPRILIQHNYELSDGWVFVTRDQPKRRPRYFVAQPSYPWINTIINLGIIPTS